MPIFIYSAADRSGKVSRGEREAVDQKGLIQALKAEGLLLLESSEKQGVKAIFRIDIKEIVARFRPISLVEKMFFARNLAVMTSAGLALTRALDALKQETTNPKFKTVIGDVNGEVIKGKSFADALRMHEKVFGMLFISMIEVGEATGKLTLVLRLLANQMKRDHALRRRVKGAMMYPAIIITALLGVGALMMIYVVPALATTIKELGVPLPLTTRLIIAVSDALAGYGILVLVIAVVAVALVWRLIRTAQGKLLFDRFSLKLPIFGPLIRKFNTARFCRTLAYLVTSGVPITRSLEVTSRVLTHTMFRAVIEQAGRDIQRGRQLSAVLAEHPHLFQPLVTQMIAVGEETGKVSDMLLRLALFFEEEVQSVTKNLSTIVEPVLMVIIGGVVGFFAISMLQPIYSSLGNL